MPRLSIAGTDVTLNLRPEETILAGLARAGYTARIGCRRGGCGICKVQVVSGAVRHQETVADCVVPPDELASGTCLVCRAVLETDTVIRVTPDFKLRCSVPFLAALARA